MSIKIVMPSLPGDPREVYKAIADALSVLKIDGEAFEVDMATVSIRVDGKNGKPTKGELIWDDIVATVESGEYKSRQEIANDANATVSRVTEVLKANAGSTTARTYRRMAEAARIAKWEDSNEVEELDDDA